MDFSFIRAHVSTTSWPSASSSAPGIGPGHYIKLKTASLQQVGSYWETNPTADGSYWETNPTSRLAWTRTGSGVCGGGAGPVELTPQSASKFCNPELLELQGPLR